MVFRIFLGIKILKTAIVFTDHFPYTWFYRELVMTQSKLPIFLLNLTTPRGFLFSLMVTTFSGSSQTYRWQPLTYLFHISCPVFEKYTFDAMFSLCPEPITFSTCTATTLLNCSHLCALITVVASSLAPASTFALLSSHKEAGVILVKA